MPLESCVPLFVAHTFSNVRLQGLFQIWDHMHKPQTQVPARGCGLVPLRCDPVMMQNAVENVYLAVLTPSAAAAHFGVSQSSIDRYITLLPRGLLFDASSESLRRHTNSLFDVSTRRSVPWRPAEMRDAMIRVIASGIPVLRVSTETLIRKFVHFYSLTRSPFLPLSISLSLSLPPFSIALTLFLTPPTAYETLRGHVSTVRELVKSCTCTEEKIAIVRAYEFPKKGATHAIADAEVRILSTYFAQRAAIGVGLTRKEATAVITEVMEHKGLCAKHGPNPLCSPQVVRDFITRTGTVMGAEPLASYKASGLSLLRARQRRPHGLQEFVTNYREMLTKYRTKEGWDSEFPPPEQCYNCDEIGFVSVAASSSFMNTNLSLSLSLSASIWRGRRSGFSVPGMSSSTRG